MTKCQTDDLIDDHSLINKVIFDRRRLFKFYSSEVLLPGPFNVFRVYYDRLIDNGDQKWFMKEIKKVFIRNFGEDFDKVFAHLDLDGKGSVDENDVR